MLSIYSTRSEAVHPMRISEPECSTFWRAYLAFLLTPVFFGAIALAAALWPADSTTTSSRPADAGSSSTGCQASTDGSSR